MKKRLPTFLGIGAHKAGTTWLFRHLRRHPEIWLPMVKELHFFDRSSGYPSPSFLATESPLKRLVKPNSAYRRQFAKSIEIMRRQLRRGNVGAALWFNKWLFGRYNEDWYAKLFKSGAEYQACGEVTPSYSILEPEDVGRIKAVNPDMKIIFIIRNPIERAWSAIRFNTDKGMMKFSLDEEDRIIRALRKESVVLRGDYERTITNFLSHFDSSQILVCYFDAIRQDKVGLMAAITDFLGVSRFDNDAIENQVPVNPSTPRQMPRKVHDHLTSVYEPMITRFARDYGSYAVDWEQELEGERIEACRRGHPPPAAFHP